MRDRGQGSGRELLKTLAREARREQTPAEKRLWELLRDHHCGRLHFRRQKVMGPFRLDVHCRQVCLAIEVDGSIHEEEGVQQRDADRQQILEQEFGIRFLRVTNEDVILRPQETQERILQTATDLPECPSSPLSRLRGSRVQLLRGRAERGGGGLLP